MEIQYSKVNYGEQEVLYLHPTAINIKTAVENAAKRWMEEEPDSGQQTYVDIPECYLREQEVEIVPMETFSMPTGKISGKKNQNL